MIPRNTSGLSKEVLFPRLLYCDLRCSQTCHRCSMAGPQYSQAYCHRAQVLSDTPNVLSSTPGVLELVRNTFMLVLYQ